MDSDQTNRRTAKPACITFLVLFFGIPVLVIAAVFFWYANRQSQAKSQLKQEIASLRASGLPVDNVTLGEYYESLTDRERTEQWLRIFEQLESPEFAESAQRMPILGEAGTEEVPLAGESWDEEEEVEAFLQSQQSLLADLHDAASEPGAVWFPTEFDSLDTLIPHAQTARTAARLLQLEHDAAVYAGDGERAAQSIRSLLGLAEMLRGEPFIVGQLVRIAIHGMATSAMQRSVEQNVLDEEYLVDLLSRLREFDDYRASYRTALAGERALALPVFENPARADAAIPTAAGSRSRDALAALHCYEQMEQVAEEENLNAFVQTSARLYAEMDAEFSSAGMLKKYETILTQVLLPASDAFAQAIARQVMQNRLAKLGIGVRLYRHRFGEWPAKLDDLRTFGIDPASLVPLGGKPFGYRIEEETAVLWGFNPGVPSADGIVLTAVPDEPPPLDDPNQLANESLEWRLVP